VPGTGWHPVPYPGDPVPVIPAGTELYEKCSSVRFIVLEP
jgi:hypothetical protein